jgi:acyl CoA:acetate/3-ketoacid CoA transferase beta subunit
LTSVHPGRTVKETQAATGWDLRVAADVHETTPPTDDELAALRALRTKGDA